MSASCWSDLSAIAGVVIDGDDEALLAASSSSLSFGAEVEKKAWPLSIEFGGRKGVEEEEELERKALGFHEGGVEYDVLDRKGKLA